MAERRAGGFELRLLGELTIVHRHGNQIPPTSRKLQALLAYLALTPYPVQRGRLCALFWDLAVDPRGELRWYLSKLRGLLGADRVVCEADAVRLDLTDCVLDAREVECAARDDWSPSCAERAPALLKYFRGDFLEGLEIDGCPRVAGWLMAQRRHFRALQVVLLERLAQRANGEDAVQYTERWLDLAPLDVRAHVGLLQALARAGRAREADEQFRTSMDLLAVEGIDSRPLAEGWRALAPRRRSAMSSSPPVRVSAAADADAYDDYLMGRQHLTRMMRRGLDESRRLFSRALKTDASYAPAWAGLAIARACLAEWFDPGMSNVARADEASRRALELAPRLAEAHAARGLALSLTRSYGAAEREFDEAIHLDPYLFDGYYYYGRTAFACGDMTKAARLFRDAMDARREDFQSAMLLGMSLRALGRESEAHVAASEGVRRAERILLLNPHDGRALSLGAGALVDDGQIERALKWSKQALELYPGDTSALVNVACVYARVGQAGEALDLLERVFAQGYGKRDWVENDPDYRGLRSEPRFQRLLGGLT